MDPTMERRRDSHEKPHGHQPSEWPRVGVPAWPLTGREGANALHMTGARILWTYAVDDWGLTGSEEPGDVER